MKAILTSVLVAAFACVALAGCASFEQHENSAKVLVTYGTFKAIEHGEPEEHAERAAKIRDIALQARAVASGDGVILEALEAAIRAEVSELNLSAPDQYLAGVLVDMVVAELAARVCSPNAPDDPGPLCTIPADQVYVVTEVLDWVIDATALYAGA